MLRGHLDDRKDARGHRAAWSLDRIRRLRFHVYMGAVALEVSAVYRTSGNQQYMLFHPRWYGGRRPLARLCTCDEHEDTHWHYFEGPGEPRHTRPVQQFSSEQLADPGFLLTEVFAPRLQIVGLEYEGRLTDG